MELEGKLGVRFWSPALLVAAVTRVAYAKELRDKNPETIREDNERLEFLGDGVIELAVRQSLYGRYDVQEGVLSKMAGDLVSERNFAKVASDMVLERHLFLGSTEVLDENGKPTI